MSAERRQPTVLGLAGCLHVFGNRPDPAPHPIEPMRRCTQRAFPKSPRLHKTVPPLRFQKRPFSANFNQPKKQPTAMAMVKLTQANEPSTTTTSQPIHKLEPDGKLNTIAKNFTTHQPHNRSHPNAMIETASQKNPPDANPKSDGHLTKKPRPLQSLSQGKRISHHPCHQIQQTANIINLKPTPSFQNESPPTNHTFKQQ